MSKFAIQAEGLGKRYRLGQYETYTTLRDTLTRVATAPFRRLRGKAPETRHGTIWALRDVSFDVPHGQVLGVIGRNGAGKSTLLKLLSRVTEPTEGRAELEGRIASLLEVGAGFHPELSGRENIFLYGAILGMGKTEIRRKFDEIVEFAEVERFVDTPVKRYSSGMYMRLAFSVAAHLDAEILVVDEVLAVGDAKFQKKCLGKIGDVAAKTGRTTLFVSHNMDAIRRLCGRAMWLEQGRLVETGTAEQCVSKYLSASVETVHCRRFEPPFVFANGIPIHVHALELSDGQGNTPMQFSAASSIRVSIDWEVLQPLHKPRIGFVLMRGDGLELLTSCDVAGWQGASVEPGRRVSSCTIPGQLLNEGQYMFEMVADGWSDDGQTRIGHAFLNSRTGPLVRFEVVDDTTSICKHYGQHGVLEMAWPGHLLLNLPWKQSIPLSPPDDEPLLAVTGLPSETPDEVNV